MNGRTQEDAEAKWVIAMGLKTGYALQDVARERERQREHLKSGKFVNNCADPGLSNEKKLAILCEEFGEVAELVTELGEPAVEHKHPRIGPRLREELIQIAAVAVAWAESLSS